ncbi:hypothetical protein [Arabidopsis thaliana]|uniref:Uncharacterized protein n=2 Tax=Arabidopsis thaliana TaxID=3702 RepID=A0A654ENQ2_ARATH|nr:uncharacterized protein AT1G26290 [Arabidopsis thaliana]AAG50670.1 hypothetical protein [Arabidopsis thaliana]AAX55084.1 hypothetical protein At1g26290 [Arabidopsis thaliana]AEE30673.1 hypothetical protein AT1G26290 [Arabidopsis thaliana]CAA0242984.1 unnamed protein product [Arabidopsis thaliana]VYS47191.1 unnamed protein product [Arabidopsis thaliana]|eukprot:NP_173953.1 hypothetical protein AT1G26290 [Arabidopsis thaliana]
MDHKDYSRQNAERRLLLSKDEERIRDELEMEIERNLEGEFKDGIYNLALKLRRLYEQRREREELFDVSMRKSKRVLEVNINIKMEGDTKIEITEKKKEVDNEKTKKAENSDKRKKFVAVGEDKTGKEKMKNQTRAHELRWKW